MKWEYTVTNWIIFLNYYTNSTINFKVEKLETVGTLSQKQF
jgi:hypothetical protein